MARDFGDPRFGRTPNTAGFVGRRMNLLGRSIEVGEGDPAAALTGYLSEERTASARTLARKAALLLEPLDRRGAVVWPPGQLQADGGAGAVD